ncbi:MAG: hypothetical protein HY397_03400 [Candidatus Doudnabacteria bacterium]|nr:hypothetical protein [Candidatus Doudnabacteria bacterium]
MTLEKTQQLNAEAQAKLQRALGRLEEFWRRFDNLQKLPEDRNAIAASIAAHSLYAIPDILFNAQFPETVAPALRKLLDLATAPNWGADGRPEGTSVAAVAQKVIVGKLLPMCHNLKEIEITNQLLEFLAVRQNRTGEPYPYVIREVPYFRFVAEFLWPRFCVVDLILRRTPVPAEFLAIEDALVRSALNWGMGHLLPGSLVARKFATVLQFCADSDYAPTSALLGRLGNKRPRVDVSTTDFDPKDFGVEMEEPAEATRRAAIRLLRHAAHKGRLRIEL